MTQYFAYSDEAGSYKRYPGQNHLDKHPYDIRGTIIVRSDDWLTINASMRAAKTAAGLNPSIEVKWTHLQTALGMRLRGAPINPMKEYGYLSVLSEQQIISLRDNLFHTLNALDSPKIIYTVTDHSLVKNFTEANILKMHLQDTMQRIQMEIGRADNLCSLHIDRVSNRHDKQLRNVYNKLFESGDLLQYEHIHDCANLVDSHHSVGIQLADLATGAFYSTLRDHDIGPDTYWTYVEQYLRFDHDNDPFGYGIVVVPKALGGDHVTHREAICSLLYEV